MEISVIVCTKNAEKTLEACLKSIEENEPSEIILIDGNSSDATVLYCIVWSVSSNIGLATGLTQLIFQKLRTKS